MFARLLERIASYVVLVHDVSVSTSQFVASLVGSLSWPVVVVGAMIIFHRQLGELLGRIKSYRGLGQELTFIEDALRNSEVGSIDTGFSPDTDLSPLMSQAERNPSFVIIRAWDQVLDAIAELFAAVFPEEGRRRTEPLGDLQKKNIASSGYFAALRALRDLRNRVAHGEANPTPGEAVAYLRSAEELAKTARIMAQALRGVR